MTIPCDDRGLTLGDGLFETVLADRSRLDLWVAHVARLQAGCAWLGLPSPDEAELRQAAIGALAAAGLQSARAAVRLTWTAGSGGRGLDRPQAPAPRLFATAAPAPEVTGGVNLVTVGVRRNQASPASRLKSLSYLDNVLARAEARAAGGDEGLMLNGRGELACAAAANVFWIREGRLLTPALDCGVLEGVMRAAVLAAAARIGVQCLEARLPRDALDGASVFLTNSLIGLREVEGLDGRETPSDPLARAIARALRD